MCASAVALSPERELLTATDPSPRSTTAGMRERVSIHPLLPIRFSHSTGLFYPMDGLLLEPGGLIGTSNEGIGGQVQVVPDDDTPWLLILGKERLWDLMGASQSAA